MAVETKAKVAEYGSMPLNDAALRLDPMPLSTRPLRRVPQLLGGLWLYGTSMAMQVRGGLGLNPWDVLHQGLSRRTGLSFGTITALTGLAVLLCWIPVRQRPGVGTVANVLVIAISVDVTLAVLPAPSWLAARMALLVAGVVLNGLATAVYLGTRLGPGPRDGLMTGVSARTGLALRLVRTGIEVTVLAVGWLLGGTVGVGTVLYALAIGPLTQTFLRLTVVPDTAREKARRA